MAGTRPRSGVELKILHVLDHSLPLHSGYAFRSVALFREQRRMGWKTAHLTTPKHTAEGPAEEEIDGFRFYRTAPLAPFIGGRAYIAELALIAAAARRIVQVAAIERPHILHAHSPVLNALACLLAARRLGLPVAYEIRGFWEDAAVSHRTASARSLRYRASRGLETFALRRCGAITTICEGLRRDIVRRGLPASKITVIPNGVDPSEFRFSSADDDVLRSALGLQGKLVVGFIGSFYGYEGLDLLLSALRLAVEKLPSLALVLVGGGPAEQTLRFQAERLGLSNIVRFIGRVPHAEVHKYYDLIEMLVYPRRPMRLTELVTPLKPLEAMARGRLVLASNVGGHRELIRNGETGYLFEAGCVEALSRAIIDLIVRRHDWAATQANARRYVEQERAWSRCAMGYAGVYANLLRSGS